MLKVLQEVSGAGGETVREPEVDERPALQEGTRLRRTSFYETFWDAVGSARRA